MEPSGSAVKNRPAKARAARDLGSISGLGRSSGEGNDNPLQYSCLGNPMDRGAWQAKESESHSVMSDSLRPHGLYKPWNSPAQNTGEGSHSLLQGLFPTQDSNPGVSHCRRILYQLSHKGSPRILEWVAYPFSSRSYQPRNRTGVSCIAGGFFTNWAIREFRATVHVVTKESDTTAIKQQQQPSTQQAVCTFAYASPYRVTSFPKVFYQATFNTFHTSAPSAASPNSSSWTSSHNDRLPLSHHHHVPNSAHTSILAFTLSWNYLCICCSWKPSLIHPLIYSWYVRYTEKVLRRELWMTTPIEWN